MRAGAMGAVLMWVAAAGCGGGDPGLIDCEAYVDHTVECGVTPQSVRDTNVRICDNWEATYKEPVMEALDQCVDVPCDQLQTCAAQANQLCQADVSGSIDQLCEKVVECGWEELTTTELCVEELTRNQLLYACWRPDVLEDYVSCVRGITCGPESEDAWYGCGFEIQSR